MSYRPTIRSGRPPVLFTAAALMFGTLLGSAAYAGPVVPWLNQPAAERAAPAAAAPNGAFPCASTDLQIVAGPAGAYRGQATQEIRLTNIGANACHLPGFPAAQLMPAGESPQSVGPSEAAPQLATERIDIAPGQEVIMLLGTPGSCDAAARPQRKVSRRIQLALPGGGIKVLDGVYLDTLCGRANVVKFQPVQKEGTAATTPSLSLVTGTMVAPDEAVRGGTVRYTVTLSNPSANPVSLAACPAYTQTIYSEGKSSASTMLLNCGGAGGQIPAKASVSFEMQAQVPADLAPGSAKLSWKLQDGPGVGKVINLR
jgi:hypothetical protein